MVLSILGLFAVQSSAGIAVDASLTAGFVVVAAIAAVLATLGLLPVPSMLAEQLEAAPSTP